MKNIKALEQKIDKIKTKLMAVGDMHAGSLSMQYNVCGKKGCRCKDPDAPQKHGPYYQLSYVHQGKSTSRFIRKEYVVEIKKQTANYQKFKTLTQDWANLAIELSQLKADHEKISK